ncbi:hypothetical protein V7O66_06435 [Methanolobus sp. ZRKC3]|uniref:hypothetical protein n=1 Tax=Methanolobus sp. ZRKC3 TaxID=3125786 RepID=UPI00324D25D7
MNYLYNLREWLYECDRFLFLAEVHYHKNNVVPSGHKFNYDFSGNSLDEIFFRTKSQCENEFHCVSFDTCISKEEFAFIMTILDNIKSEKWGLTGTEDILRSQKILHNLISTLTDDIANVHESKGYPSLCKICNMQ